MDPTSSKMPNMQEAKLDMYDDATYNIDPQQIEGDMDVENSRQKVDMNGPGSTTLDEPISETIMREARAVAKKFCYVLYPRDSKNLLKEWDLWGPLVLCLFMALMLRGSSKNYEGPDFVEVFVIVWIGAAVVTLNTKLLGGNISFFQSVCVLGYCLLPTTIALILCRTILIFEQTTLLFLLRFVVTSIGFAWATYASMAFLGDCQPAGRKALAVYPIFLFYVIISWLVISLTK